MAPARAGVRISVLRERTVSAELVQGRGSVYRERAEEARGGDGVG